MTKLDDLKASILYYKKRDGSWPKEFGYEVKFSTLETLIQIAETAFEMPEPNVFDYDDKVNICGACGGKSARNAIPASVIDHEEWCQYQRIQELKKELESG